MENIKEINVNYNFTTDTHGFWDDYRLNRKGQGFRIIKFSEARVFKEAKVMVQCRSGGRNDITRNIRSDKRRTNRQM